MFSEYLYLESFDGDVIGLQNNHKALTITVAALTTLTKSSRKVRRKGDGDWQLARGRRGRSKKRPPPPPSCAPALSAQREPRLSQVSDCSQRVPSKAVPLMCRVLLCTKLPGSCLNWQKKGRPGMSQSQGARTNSCTSTGANCASTSNCRYKIQSNTVPLPQKHETNIARGTTDPGY